MFYSEIVMREHFAVLISDEAHKIVFHSVYKEFTNEKWEH